MQANFLIDKQLAQNLIDFFANSWITTHSSYGYNPKQASASVISHIGYAIKEGFSTSWSLGGTSNNCWGDSHTVSAEVEPDLPYLDEFFIEFYPQVSFMQYKIVTKAVQTSTSSDSDYYGGNTTNGNKTLDFQSLSESMIKAKILNNPSLVRMSELNDYIKENYSTEKMEEIFKPAVSKTKKINKKK